jgi:poly(3-hydroxybutyrate) depolymerase
VLAVQRFAAAASLPTLNIDKNNIGVAGISAGGAMAQQFHVAQSATIKHMASIAGPPYWCAQDSISNALSSCEYNPFMISTSTLVNAAKNAFSQKTIDDPVNMNSSRVWMFSGKSDTVVFSGVVEKGIEFYKTFISNAEQVEYVNNIAAQHSWVTGPPFAYGNSCSYQGSPYVNNCNYDASGEFLKFWFPSESLKQPVKFVDSNVRCTSLRHPFSKFFHSFWSLINPNLFHLANP